jgi:hypothetical protein
LSFAEGKVSYHYWKAKSEELDLAERDLNAIEEMLNARKEEMGL